MELTYVPHLPPFAYEESARHLCPPLQVSYSPTDIAIIDNVDYNSLKHEIKVHTTRDQATALTIPGHPDTALRRFEDALYNELCHQHDRLDLFVTSKADEVSRRLGMLAP